MNKTILFLFLLIIFISGCGISIPKEVVPSKNLPDDFTIKLYYDITSSGGDKINRAILTFKDSLVVSGWKQFDGGIRVDQERFVKECSLDINSLKWQSGEGECDIVFFDFPLGKSELEKELTVWSEKSEEECPHATKCYQLII